MIPQAEVKKRLGLPDQQAFEEWLASVPDSSKKKMGRRWFVDEAALSGFQQKKEGAGNSPSEPTRAFDAAESVRTAGEETKDRVGRPVEFLKVISRPLNKRIIVATKKDVPGSKVNMRVRDNANFALGGIVAAVVGRDGFYHLPPGVHEHKRICTRERKGGSAK